MRQDTGVDGDAQRISQLCWMFFLKIIDDQDQELELMSDNTTDTKGAPSFVSNSVECIRPIIASATVKVLTKITRNGFISSTTPSTPLHDAHQEGYSFIKVAFSVLHPDGRQNPLDASTLPGVTYSHQHLPHLSTMCTAGGFFLPKSQQVVTA